MHTTKLLHTYQHWPTESLEHHTVRLPTLRVHRYISTLGIELEHLPMPTCTNEIADTQRYVSRQIDAQRAARSPDILAPMHTPEYLKAHRRLCAPIHFHKKLLKHLSPLWQEGITHWKDILHKTASGDDIQLHVQNPKAIHATLLSGDNKKPTKTLQTALLTLRAILFTDTTTEQHTLPQTFTTTTTKVHHS